MNFIMMSPRLPAPAHVLRPRPELGGFFGFMGLLGFRGHAGAIGDLLLGDRLGLALVLFLKTGIGHSIGSQSAISNQHPTSTGTK